MRIAASYGGLKNYLVCDGNGCPVPLRLTAGTGGGGIAKPGHDANHPRNWLNSAEAPICIPTQNSDKVQVGQNIDLSKLRDILERMFEFLKNWHNSVCAASTADMHSAQLLTPLQRSFGTVWSTT